MVKREKLKKKIEELIKKFDRMTKRDPSQVRASFMLHLRFYLMDERTRMEDLAKRIGVTRMTIYRWKVGKSYPTKLALRLLEKEGIYVRAEDKKA